MYAAFLATLVVMLRSETLVDSVWLLVVLFILFNAFFFFDVYPRYRYEDIDVLDFRVLQRGMVQHPLCPRQLIDRILQSPDVDSEQKAQLKRWSPPKASSPSTMSLPSRAPVLRNKAI